MIIIVARSKWKLIYFNRIVYKNMFFLKFFKRKFRRFLFARSSSIPLCFNGKVIQIHKGLEKRILLIKSIHTGYKFGEFAFTRKPFYFVKKEKKNKKNFIKR